MRQIKFRAWDTQLNNYQFSGWGSKTFSIFTKRTNCPRYIIEQFTGLKDIWEGDTVEDNIGIGYIEYVDKYAAFRVNYRDGQCKWFYHYLDSEMKCLKKTGNIHEN